MSYTKSTIFDTYASTSGHQRDVVLAITQNSITYYFSTRPMPRGLNSEPVYPMLISHGALTDEIDIFSKQWAVSDMKITLSEEPFYPQDGGPPIRVSELLEGLNGEVCELYQWVDGITDIADCLLIFSGYILQSLEVTKSHAKFTAKDRSKMWEKKIPERIIKDEWPDAPAENLTRPIPIVYGFFDTPDVYDLDDEFLTGLAEAIAIEPVQNGIYVVADHAVKGILTNYRDTGGPSTVPALSGGASDVLTGPSTTSISQAVRLDFDLSPTLPGVYSDESYLEPLAIRNKLIDFSHSEICTLEDRLSDDGDEAEGLALWGIEHEAVLRQHVVNTGYLRQGYRAIDWSITDWPQNEISDLRFYLYYGTEGGDQRSNLGWATKSGGGGSEVFSWNNSTVVYSGDETQQTDVSMLDSENPGEKWAVGLYSAAGVVGSSSSDGIVGNANIMSIVYSNLRYQAVTGYQPNAWSGVRGKVYSSAIATDRPPSTVDVNTDPAYIIEDMYREYVGLGDADVDMDSIDASANANVETRINITDHTKITDVARTLSEQATFVVSTSGVSGLRCIPLNDRNPTIVDTIRREQLIGDDFLMTKTRFIVNEMEIGSRWQPEHGHFTDHTTYTDTASQDEVRPRIGKYKWENISNESVSHVASHYVNDTDGIWSKEHIKVSFKTPGFMHSYLQTGDWIRFDTSVDGLKTAFGTSWATKNLLILNTQKNMDFVVITAIELYNDQVAEGSPSPSPSPSASPSPSPDPSASPTGDAPWGRYGVPASQNPATLAWNVAMTDGNTSIEVGSDNGWIASNDEYCLEEASAWTPTRFLSFNMKADRNVASGGLTNGSVEIWYSNNNIDWTKWGSTRTYYNGGINALVGAANIIIVGNGSFLTTAKFWKIHIISNIQDASGNFGLTELLA